MTEQFATKLATLKAAIPKATPGPWEVNHRHGDMHLDTPQKGSIMCDMPYYPWVPERDDFTYIAAASPDFLSELISRYEELEAASKWIPVSQELPDKEGRYLVRYKQYSQVRTFIADIYYEGGEWRWASLLGAEILYWLPIPTPPVVEEDAPKEK